MAKSSTDSPLARLPLEQRNTLTGWLLDDGLPCAEARTRLADEFGVEVSAQEVLYFYRHYCAPLRLRRAAQAANALPELSGQLMVNWEVGSVALVQQRYFELLATPSIDPKELALFASQIAEINRSRLQRDRLKHQRRQLAQTTRIRQGALALQREKFEFDATKTALEHAAEIKTIASDRSLSAEARVDAVRRRLFPQAFPKEGSVS